MRVVSRASIVVGMVVGALGVVVPGTPAFAVASISATKVDALLIDADTSGDATSGDTLRYTITVQNTGDENATNGVLNDTIDNNTTLVPGSLQSTPLARHDSYSTVGNVPLTVTGATGVLLNDSDPDGSGGLTVLSFSPSTANGGSVGMSTNGSFTYNPPPGFSGTDTFTYTATDGESNTNSATVAVTVGQVVWFINNAVGGPGDGRFTSPFNSITNFNSLAADDPGDYVFVYRGSGAYPGAVTLLDDQQLIGHGAGLTVSPNLAISAASRPTLSNGVTVNADNTVKGLNISAATGVGLFGQDVGALQVSGVSVTVLDGIGVRIDRSTAGMSAVFDSVSAASAVNGIFVIDAAGTFEVNGGTIDPSDSFGAIFSNVTGGPLDVTLRNMTFTGTPANRAAAQIQSSSTGSIGDVEISGNTFSNNLGTGLRVSPVGSVDAGLVEVSGNTFTANPTGIDLDVGGTVNVDFDIDDNDISGAPQPIIVTNSGSGTAEGYIRNNTITLDPGVAGGIGVVLDLVGNGGFVADITNNTVTDFSHEGISVQSRGGSGTFHVRVANNLLSTTTILSPEGLVMVAGGINNASETNLLCANVSSNSITTNARDADYVAIERGLGTPTMQLQGLTPSPATSSQTIAFLVSTDTSPPATAFASGGATFTAATCNTVSFAAPAASAAPSALATAPVRSAPGTPPGSGDGPVLPFSPITPSSLGTLNAGESVTISFDVTIDDPIPPGTTQVCNQGNVTADGGINVLTNDPDTAAPDDPTCTPVTPGEPPIAGTVAFVAGGPAGSPKDQPVINRLTALGLTVTVIDDDDLTPAAVSDADLVVLASSVVPTKVANKLTNLPVPVISWEGTLSDELLLGTMGAETATTQTAVTITNPAHPVAAGRTGTTVIQTVATKFNRVTTAAAGVVVVATAGGSPSILAADIGAALTTGTAPARRVVLAWNYDSPPAANANGLAIFDAAVDWALEGTVPPPGPATVTIASTTKVEGDAGSSNAQLTVTASSAQTTNLVVAFQTVNGTAQTGTDYTATTGTTTILAGQTSATIDVPVLGDTLDEPNESFSVKLTGVTGPGSVGSPSAAPVLITDDDPPPGVSQVAFIAGTPGGALKDKPAIARLGTLGLTVTVIDDDAVSAVALGGYELIVLSSSVAPTTITDKLTNLAIPIVSWEGTLSDELLLGTKGAETTGTQTAVTITSPAHPVAAGLAGSTVIQTAATKLNRTTTAAPGVVVVGTAGGAPSILAAETNAVLTTGTAPARRVVIAWSYDSPPVANTKGFKIFDAAITWAIASPPSCRC